MLTNKLLNEKYDIKICGPLELVSEKQKKILDVEEILNNKVTIEQLDETNFLLYAARCYDNPQCYDTYEFQEDLNRFKYIKRLFRRYSEEGDLKERLILNHIVILFNVFGSNTPRMLFMKMRGFEVYLKTFFIYLNIMPEVIEKIGIDCRTLYSKDITIDEDILKRLQKL